MVSHWQSHLFPSAPFSATIIRLSFCAVNVVNPRFYEPNLKTWAFWWHVVPRLSKAQGLVFVKCVYGKAPKAKGRVKMGDSISISEIFQLVYCGHLLYPALLNHSLELADESFTHNFVLWWMASYKYKKLLWKVNNLLYQKMFICLKGRVTEEVLPLLIFLPRSWLHSVGWLRLKPGAHCMQVSGPGAVMCCLPGSLAEHLIRSQAAGIESGIPRWVS